MPTLTETLIKKDMNYSETGYGNFPPEFFMMSAFTILLE